MTVQCCVCKKVKSEDAWTLTHLDRPAEVSHTYCPACLRDSQRAIRQEQRQADLAGYPATA